MNEITISVRRGAPFKVLFIVLFIWVMGRVILQGGVPTGQLRTLPAALQIETALLDEVMSFSQTLPNVLMAGHSSMAPFPGIPFRSEIEGVPKGLGPKGLGIATQDTPSRQLLPQLTSIPAVTALPESIEPQKIVSSVSPRLTSDRRPAAVPTRTSSALSGYFWLFARQGSGPKRLRSTSPASQFSVAQYGASQAGAILTYKMLGDSSRNISTFARAATALSSSGQEELAIGIKTKPLSDLPISFFAEQRFRAGEDSNHGTAFYLAGGTGPDLLLPETSLETYGQMGFIFARDDSYFFDASAALQKQVIERGGHKITAGAGVWASGQEGATRVDIGPRVKFHVPVGQVDMQVSLDWRERIGGNADPGSGASVTLSTGF